MPGVRRPSGPLPKSPPQYFHRPLLAQRRHVSLQARIQPRTSLLSTLSSPAPPTSAAPRVLYQAQPISLNLLVAAGARLQLKLSAVGAAALIAAGVAQYVYLAKASFAAGALVVYAASFNGMVNRFNARFVDKITLVDPATIQVNVFGAAQQSFAAKLLGTGTNSSLLLSLTPSDTTEYVVRVRTLPDGLLVVDTSDSHSYYVVLARGKTVDPFLLAGFVDK
jgi:hypothetical protein